MIRIIKIDTGYSQPEIMTLKTNTIKEMINLINNIKVTTLGFNKTINVPDTYIIQCNGNNHLIRKYNPKTDHLVNKC